MKSLWKLLGIFGLFLLMWSCTSLKITSEIHPPQNTLPIDSVVILSSMDPVQMNKHRICSFTLKENSDLRWEHIQRNLKSFAKAHQGNIVEIYEMGWGKKGHGFYARGSVYYTDTIQFKTAVIPDCSLVIIRGDNEGLVGSAYTISVGALDTYIENFGKRDYIIKTLENCNDSVPVVVNDKVINVALEGRTRYYQVYKSTNPYSYGGFVGVTIGPVVFEEIPSRELARIMYFMDQSPQTLQNVKSDEPEGGN
ncbi:MAG: hypothetical protein SchgKO_23480 [Schleiferiaceae bacterium]